MVSAGRSLIRTIANMYAKNMTQSISQAATVNSEMQTRLHEIARKKGGQLVDSLTRWFIPFYCYIYWRMFAHIITIIFPDCGYGMPGVNTRPLTSYSFPNSCSYTTWKIRFISIFASKCQNSNCLSYVTHPDQIFPLDSQWFDFKPTQGKIHFS